MLGALLLLLFSSSALAKLLASGGYHTVAVQRNGQVFGTGSNQDGQLGLNTTGINVYLPRAMLLAVDVVDASCGAHHTCVVDRGGRARCAGQDRYGQLGVGPQPTYGEYEYEQRPSNSNPLLLPVSGLRTAVAEINCGVRACCARLAGGRVKCWGNYLGEYTPTPHEVGGVRGVRDLSLGTRHACFVAAGDRLYCAGTDNYYGQMGIGSKPAKRKPTPVVGLAAKNIVSVACGELHTCAVNQAGAMFCWGYNYGRLGTGTTANSNVPLQVVGLTAGVASAWSSASSSFALLQNGTVMVFGSDLYYGVYGNGTVSGQQPLPITFGMGVAGVLEVRGGYQHTCVLLQDQAVRCTGSGEEGQLGTGNWSSSMVLVPMAGVPATKAPTPNPAWNRPTSSPTPPVSKRLAGTGYHFVVLQRDGQVYATGNNQHGQLGLDSFASQVSLPQPMLAVSEATDVSAGRHHTCVVDQGGRARCAGRDKYGQLGDGSASTKRALVPVLGLDAGVVEIVCGLFASCARMADGSVRCWGQYLDRMLHAPLEIGGLGGDEVKAVSLGSGYLCFLKADGRLYCLGKNNVGQLGTGKNSTFEATPVPVVGLASENIVSVACGLAHTCAVNRAGAMFCWGSGDSGQLGNGATKGSYPSPVQVTGLAAGVASVWVGDVKSFALLRNGTVMTFGKNLYDSFPPSGTGFEALPVVFGGGVAGVVEVRGGPQTACVLLPSDEVQCSGSNIYGQMGLETDVESSVPLVPMRGIPVTTPNPAWNQPTASPTLDFVRGHKRLAGMGPHFIVLQRDGQAYATGHNYDGQLGIGSRSKAYFPKPMRRVSNATDVSAGSDHTCLVDRGGQVKCVGGNGRGQLGDGTYSRKKELAPTLNSGVAEVYCGDMASCARMQDGEATCWGMFQSNPVVIPGLGDAGVKDMSLGSSNVCFVTAAGQLFCLGSDKYNPLRFDGRSPRAVPGLENIVSVACNTWDICAVNAAGAMWCWIDSNAPQQAMASGVASVWLGGGQTFALMRSGKVQAFGLNSQGELGLGNTRWQRSFVGFGKGVSRVREVRGGRDTTCVLLRGDHAVWCTGRNQHGQLGVGDGTRISTRLKRMVGLPATRAPAKKPATAKPTKRPVTAKPNTK